MPKLSRRSSALPSTAASAARPTSGACSTWAAGSGGTTLYRTAIPASGEDAGEHEDPRHPDGAVELRPGDEREREHEPDRGADHRHRLRPVLLAREVGGERHHRRRDRAGALDHPARDRDPDVVRGRRDEAAGGEQHEPGEDHALAAEAVGRHAERDLQHGLGEAVSAERDADEHQVVAAAERRRMHREHREDHEQPQHPQGEERAEREPGTDFGGRHAGGCRARAGKILHLDWRRDLRVSYSSGLSFAHHAS